MTSFIYYPLLDLLTVFDPNTNLEMETRKCLMNQKLLNFP